MTTFNESPTSSRIIRRMPNNKTTPRHAAEPDAPRTPESPRIILRIPRGPGSASPTKSPKSPKIILRIPRSPGSASTSSFTSTSVKRERVDDDDATADSPKIKIRAIRLRGGIIKSKDAPKNGLGIDVCKDVFKADSFNAQAAHKIKLLVPRTAQDLLWVLKHGKVQDFQVSEEDYAKYMNSTLDKDIAIMCARFARLRNLANAANVCGCEPPVVRTIATALSDLLKYKNFTMHADMLRLATEIRATNLARMTVEVMESKPERYLPRNLNALDATRMCETAHRAYVQAWKQVQPATPPTHSNWRKAALNYRKSIIDIAHETTEGCFGNAN